MKAKVIPARSSKKQTTMYSVVLWGLISPYPIVVIVVIEKYIAFI